MTGVGRQVVVGDGRQESTQETRETETGGGVGHKEREGGS